MIKKKVLVLGDSHSDIFKNLKIKKYLIFSYEFLVKSVGGATASGLKNPNSKTKAYEIFNDALKHEKYDHIIMMLGEVDTGFVIWYRAKKYGISADESLKVTVETYSSFMNKIKSKRLTVISAPLPTIKDGQTWGEVANLRKEITASQKERTDLTIKFNKIIQEYCERNTIKYLNLDNYVLGKDGLLLEEYYSKNPLDHHYDTEKFKKLIEKYIKRYL